jgi:hypothetical protein
MRVERVEHFLYSSSLSQIKRNVPFWLRVPRWRSRTQATTECDMAGFYQGCAAYRTKSTRRLTVSVRPPTYCGSVWTARRLAGLGETFPRATDGRELVRGSYEAS